MKAKSSICPKKKQKELVFERDILTCEYHCAMLSGLSLISDHLDQKAKDGEKLRVLICGTGAGVFTMFVRQHFDLEQLVTIDVNPDMLRVAHDHFGLHTDDAIIDSKVADAYEYVKSAPAESFDLIFMDVNYEEGDTKISPPMKFFDAEFIQQVHNIAKPSGLIAFNTIIDKQHKQKCFAQVKQVKDSIKFITKA